MKKTVLIFGAVSLLLIGLSAPAFAYSFSGLYQETYWEPAGGYDYGPNYNPSLSLGTYIGTGSLPNYGYQTVLDYFIDAGLSNVSEVPITYVYRPSALAGTWASTSSVDFLMVKGATSFSIFQYDPASLDGIWNVGYLADAGGSGMPSQMSFVRAFNAGISVPEPSTMLLLGIGLFGLVGYGRKKFKTN